MTLPKLAVIVALGIVAFVLVTTVAVYLLWSSGQDKPDPNQPVTTLRQP